ncbi:hypothetical protein AAP_00501 [Ascosphaera apis ARSEF 7405]|uniref:Uncharacterized protein n=1 Tax=Ascosphaera apis ARSEF 7405 TaxID=392613 RepID=A0A166PPH0_9EURO|nr:hypothetical protein AAP_00501 [Ascosphaera apis ARSEF 7405]
MDIYFRRLREEPGFINLGRADFRDVRQRLFAKEPHLIDRYPNGRYSWGGWQFEVRHDGLHFLPLDGPTFKSLFEDNPSGVIPNAARGIHAPAVPPLLQPIRIPQKAYAVGINFWETYWRDPAHSADYGKPRVFIEQEEREAMRQASRGGDTPDPLLQPTIQVVNPGRPPDHQAYHRGPQ